MPVAPPPSAEVRAFLARLERHAVRRYGRRWKKAVAQAADWPPPTLYSLIRRGQILPRLERLRALERAVGADLTGNGLPRCPLRDDFPPEFAPFFHALAAEMAPVVARAEPRAQRYIAVHLTRQVRLLIPYAEKHRRRRRRRAPERGPDPEIIG
jgi:hypothetical protein